MRKTAAVALAVVMTVGLAACGEVKPETATPKPTKTFKFIERWENRYLIDWKMWPVGFEKRINTAIKTKNCADMVKIEQIVLDKPYDYDMQLRKGSPRGTMGMLGYVADADKYELQCNYTKVYRKRDKYGNPIWYWQYKGMTDAQRDKAIAKAVAEAKR